MCCRGRLAVLLGVLLLSGCGLEGVGAQKERPASSPVSVWSVWWIFIHPAGQVVFDDYHAVQRRR